MEGPKSIVYAGYGEHPYTGDLAKNRCDGVLEDMGSGEMICGRPVDHRIHHGYPVEVTRRVISRQNIKSFPLIVLPLEVGDLIIVQRSRGE